MQQAFGQEQFGPVAPWWSHGLAWMVWAGPAIVALASFVTLGLALFYPDPELHPKQLSLQQAPAEGGSNLPALPARNHAAEGH